MKPFTKSVFKHSRMPEPSSRCEFPRSGYADRTAWSSREASIGNAVYITKNQSPMVSLEKDPMPFQFFKPHRAKKNILRWIFQRMLRFPERKRSAFLVVSVLLPLAALWLLGSPAHAIERRKPQFLKDPSYLILPLPYSLAGIGQGVLLTVLGGNIGGTNIDAFGVIVTGDVTGNFVSVEDIHAIEETLIFALQNFNINKAIFNSYDQRGMNSDGKVYKLIELDQLDGQLATVTLSLFDRRLELFGGFEKQKRSVTRIRDQDGNLIAELSTGFKSESETTFFGFVADYTDDRQDPREGIRLQVTRRKTPPASDADPDTFVWDYTLTGYIPFGNSTLAIHYFRSDAQVVRQGQTNRTAIETELCESDPTCISAVQDLVDQLIAARKNGTSTSLGGDQRLRSYPQGRFQGAHTEFYSLEFRWNFSTAVTPFNYFIWKDIRTGLQVAFFAEAGSVGETRNEVGNTFATTFGVGFRMISGSGLVYRADLATGNEGTEISVIFNYPF